MTIQRISGTGQDDFGLDELVADNAAVHIERMDRNHVWLSVETAGERVSINLIARGTIHALIEQEST